MNVLIIELDHGVFARPVHQEVSFFSLYRHILESTSRVSAIFIFNVKLTFRLLVISVYSKVLQLNVGSVMCRMRIQTSLDSSRPTYLEFCQ